MNASKNKSHTARSEYKRPTDSTFYDGSTAVATRCCRLHVRRTGATRDERAPQTFFNFRTTSTSTNGTSLLIATATCYQSGSVRVHRCASRPFPWLPIDGSADGSKNVCAQCVFVSPPGLLPGRRWYTCVELVIS